MKRRVLFCVLTVLCITVGFLAMNVFAATVVASGTCGAEGDNLTWTLDDEGTLTISGTGAMDSFAIYDNPWQEYHKQIIRVVVKEGVTTIGTNAFCYFESMQEINLPNTLEKIEYNAFCDVDCFTKIVMPASLSSMESDVFRGCRGLSLVEFTGDAPESVVSGLRGLDATVVYPADNPTWTDVVLQSDGLDVDWIPSDRTSDGGVYGRYNISWSYENGKVTIHSDQYIKGWITGENPPWHPYRGLVEEVVVTGTAMELGSKAFCHFSNLKKVSLPDHIKVIYSNCFKGCYNLADINLPDALLTISEYAFADCYSLKEIVLPKSVDHIWEHAFDSCKSLEKVTLPQNLQRMDRNAFKNCKSLKEVYFVGDMPRLGENVFSTDGMVIYYPKGNSSWSETKIAAMKQTAISGNITLSPYNAGPQNACGDNLTWHFEGGVLTIKGTGPMFDYNNSYMPPWMDISSQVTKVIVEQGATSISHKAFIQFAELTEVSLPSTVQTIGGQAFGWCRKLKTITIPEGVQKIGDFCFTECVALETVHIPASVTFMAGDVFWNCTVLKEIYFYGDAPKGLNVGSGPVTVFYPAENSTWNEELQKTFGDSITWKGILCMKGHTEEVDEAKAATCTEDGLTEGKHCSVCGEVTQAQETVPATGHTEEIDAAVDPTCTETGLTEGKHCSVCGEITLAQEPIPATGHTEEVDAGTSSTCTETGLTEGKHCSVCNEVITPQEVIPATGHSFGDWVVTQEPTTETEGVQERSCSACGATEQQKLEKLQPNYTWVFVLAGVLVVGAAGAVILVKRKKQ